MLIIQKTPIIDLQLFADGGTGDGAGANGNDAGSQPGENQQAAQPTEPAQDAAAKSEPVSAEDRAARFEEMIKGEYRDLYDAKVQEIVKNRLKSSEKAVKAWKAMANTRDLLAKRYNVDANDFEALNAAIEDDNAWYEKEAFEKGMSVEDYKAVTKLERENSRLKAEMESYRQEEEVHQAFLNLREQAEQVKAIYPQFDLQTELQNEEFQKLVRQPTISVKTAYEVVHMNELMNASVHQAVQTTAQQVTNAIKSGSRPAEGVNAKTAAAKTVSDVSQLSNAEFNALKERIRRGERVML